MFKGYVCEAAYAKAKDGGKCYCDKGAEGQASGGEDCQKCAQGYYKEKHEDGNCLKCPAHTDTKQVGSTSKMDCICSEMYIRYDDVMQDNELPECVRCVDESMDCTTKGNTLGTLQIKNGYWAPPVGELEAECGGDMRCYMDYIVKCYNYEGCIYNATATGEISYLASGSGAYLNLSSSADMGCNVGYTGAMCSVCDRDAGFVRDIVGDTCMSCDEVDFGVQVFLVVIGALGFVVVCAILVKLYMGDRKKVMFQRKAVKKRDELHKRREKFAPLRQDQGKDESDFRTERLKTWEVIQNKQLSTTSNTASSYGVAEQGAGEDNNRKYEKNEFAVRLEVDIVMQVFINYLQFNALSGDLQVRWSNMLFSMFDVESSGSSVPLDLSALACLMDVSTYSKFMATMAIPFMAMFASFAFNGIRKVINLIRSGSSRLKKGKMSQLNRAKKNVAEEGNTKRSFFRSQAVQMCSILFYLIYQTLVKTCFKMMRCENVGLHSYMADDMSIECFKGEHSIYYALAIVFLLLYGAGIPLVMTMIVFPYRKQLLSKKAEKFGFIYGDYKLKYWWWSCMIFARKLALAFVVIVMNNPELSYFQILAAIVLCEVCCWLQYICQPFNLNSKNRLEMLSLATTTMTLHGALIFHGSTGDPNQVPDGSVEQGDWLPYATSWALFVINLCFVIVVAVVIVRILKEKFKAIYEKASVKFTTFETDETPQARRPWKQPSGDGGVRRQITAAKLKPSAFLKKTPTSTSLTDRNDQHGTGSEPTATGQLGAQTSSPFFSGRITSNSTSNGGLAPGAAPSHHLRGLGGPNHMEALELAGPGSGSRSSARGLGANAAASKQGSAKNKSKKRKSVVPRVLKVKGQGQGNGEKVVKRMVKPKGQAGKGDGNMISKGPDLDH